MEYKILSEIKSPNDLKQLNNEQVETLCDEIRHCLITTVSKNGGHLASNLGVVELTVALHRTFDSPEDSIIFDVGHQCYTHKMLTGRFDRISTLRKEGGLSGFMRPGESVHDPITTGHSSNSISAAYGIYKAKQILGEKGTAVAVVGDGALTGGMAFEALNNVGADCGNFIVVLNDNKMSISKNVGALARYLSKIRSKPNYHKFKGGLQKFLLKIPFIGKFVFRFIFRIKTLLKNAIYHSNIFEGLGFNYLGPVDGHNEETLEDILTIAKNQTRPVIVHVITTKGKGYKFAEVNPNAYHGVQPFNVSQGADVGGNDNFSHHLGKTLCSLAEEDEKICAITAAMTEGTGLKEFANKFKNRFFDVGIAEQHAVTFAAGLAKGGMKPVFAVYSSFLQRGFDQVIHDAATANVSMTICVDRAGFVGEDGETHQGLFDVAYLSQIPNVTIYAPSNYDELDIMLKKAIYSSGVSVVRYPRGSQNSLCADISFVDESYTVYGKGKTALVSYGRIVGNLLSAQKRLTDVAVIKINKVSPFDKDIVLHLKNYEKVFFFEEGIKNGGIGERLGSLLSEQKLGCNYKNIAVDSTFVSAAPVSSQIEKFGLDENSIIKTVKGE